MGASKKKERNNQVNIGLYINTKTYESIVKIARDKELTMSDIVRIALREYIEKNN
jgi:hypothetical protein